VRLPNGEIISVTAKEAGLSPDAAAAAVAAYGYGRSVNIISAAYKYIVGMLGAKTELNTAEMSELDEAAVRAKVTPAVKNLNSALGGESFVLFEDRIEILKGFGTALADEDEVYALVIDTLQKAAENEVAAAAEYDLPTSSGGDVDIESLYNSVKTEPVSAKYDLESKAIVPGVRGVSFDLQAAQSAVMFAETGEIVKIPLILTEPEVTEEMLRETLFRDVLAERETYIDGTTNRLTNITLASEAINGTVLNPGDIFSYNGVVGERTAAKGYMSAGAYSGGRTVQEIGGGICQVSSTIYDCVLHADLEVTDRRNHQFIVSYLPVGNDATVNWGTTDFKFKNSTAYPLRIDITITGRDLLVKLVGTKTGTGSIKTYYETISTKDYKTIEVEDETIEPGTTKVDTSGHHGYVVDTYKYYYDAEGTFIERKFVSRSSYNPQDRIVLVPVGTLTAIETPPEETSDVPPDDDAPTTPDDTGSGDDPTITPPDTTDTPTDPTDAPPQETDDPDATPTPTPTDSDEYDTTPTPPPATPTPDEEPINGEI
jgi:vancomycin resistance protein YoaR